MDLQSQTLGKADIDFAEPCTTEKSVYHPLKEAIRALIVAWQCVGVSLDVGHQGWRRCRGARYFYVPKWAGTDGAVFDTCTIYMASKA